eukprot:72030_1
MSTPLAVSTPQPTDVSAPPTPSLSYSNFRLNSMDSMSMSSFSSTSFDSSPLLRDFQEMSLSLTDDEDDIRKANAFDQISPVDPDHDRFDNSLFVFDDHTTRRTNTAHCLIPPPNMFNRKLLLANDAEQTELTDLSDDENDSNPFLMGLALDIPCKQSAYDSLYGNEILPECEDEDLYSNNYFDDNDGFEEYALDEYNQSETECDAIAINIDRKFMMKKYKLIKNIGIGAFGIVDQVLDRKSNEYVAIKQSRSIGDEVLKQFRKETVILQEFADCAHIIDLIDYGRNIDVNQICIGLEYMDIGSLCNIKSYTVDQIKYIARCVLIALQRLHDELYVHNDIKPDNILISSTGEVKVIDFGCTMQMKSRHEALSKSIGSIRYLSFEKRFKSPIEYTTKSDIYSFGLTISELFNGQHVHKKAVYDHYFMTSSPTLIDTSDADLNDFIAKAVDPEPNTRYSATQLLKHPFLYDVPPKVQFMMASEE